MPGFLYVRSRGGQPLRAEHRTHLDVLAARLVPDNVVARPPVVAERGNELLALFNGDSALRREETSVCLGSIFDHAAPWWKVGSGSPDGSFALLRSDGQSTELLSDATGTRTLWYVQTGDELVVSTSQRAIVMWLKSFACNFDAFAWQVSSGTLGPGLSWDRRIRALPPASRLRLDARSWSTLLTTSRVEYRASIASPERHRQELLAAITETFRGLDLDTERGALALSGGYDSRMILLMLKGAPQLRTATWGGRAALADPRNDASIAQRLAAKLRTRHSYFELDLAVDRVESVLDRFVRLGEGRSENIGGYTDGFATWKALHDGGIGSIFRGDEAFGCRPAATTTDVCRNMKCNVLGDYRADTAAPFAAVLPTQIRPSRLEQRHEESQAAWRDRLNAEFELPYVISPLNDLKLGYVDLVHPLLSRRIVERARSLPDDLRTGKKAFKSVVEQAPLDVPFAKRAAVPTPDLFLRQPAVVRVLRERLESYREGSGTLAELAAAALDLIEMRPDACTGRRSLLRRVIAKVLPRYSAPAPRLDPLRAAFRIYIIGKMQGLLKDDARALS